MRGKYIIKDVARMEKFSTVEFLQNKRNKLYDNRHLTLMLDLNFLRNNSTNWSSKKNEITSRFSKHYEYLSAQIDILNSLIEQLILHNEPIEKTEEEKEALKHYNEWVKDLNEELPF